MTSIHFPRSMHATSKILVMIWWPPARGTDGGKYDFTRVILRGLRFRQGDKGDAARLFMRNPDKVEALEREVERVPSTDFLVVSHLHAVRDKQNTFLARIRIRSLVQRFPLRERFKEQLSGRL